MFLAFIWHDFCCSLSYLAWCPCRHKKNPLQLTSGLVSRHKKSPLQLTSGVQMQKEFFTAHFWAGVQIRKEFFIHLTSGLVSRCKKLQHTSGLVHVQMQHTSGLVHVQMQKVTAHFWAGVHASVIYFVTEVICCSYIYDMWTSVQVLQVYILGQCPGVAGSMFTIMLQVSWACRCSGNVVLWSTHLGQCPGVANTSL